MTRERYPIRIFEFQVREFEVSVRPIVYMFVYIFILIEDSVYTYIRVLHSLVCASFGSIGFDHSPPQALGTF